MHDNEMQLHSALLECVKGQTAHDYYQGIMCLGYY